jgi:kumamolisin
MADRKTFNDSVIPLPRQPGLTPEGVLATAAESQHGDDMMDVHFSLSLPLGAEQQLEARVAKGEVLPLDQLDKIYTTNPDDAKALAAWLKAEGFQIVRQTSDGIYARGKVSQVAHSLEVEMSRVTKDGVTYNAAQNAPRRRPGSSS